MKTINFKILSFILITTIFFPGCSDHRYETPIKDSYWMPTPETYFIPFDIINNKVILDARINDVNGNICFEVNRRGIELSTNFLDRVTNNKEDMEFSNEHNIYPSIPYHIQVGDYSLDLPSDMSVTVNSEVRLDDTYLAFVGRDFFNNSEIAIDYKTQVITVYANSENSPISSLLLIG